MKTRIFSFLTIFLFYSASGGSQSINLDSTFGITGSVVLKNYIWAPNINSKIVKSDDNLYFLDGTKDIDLETKLTIVKMDLGGQLDLNYFNNGVNVTNLSLDKMDALELISQTIAFSRFDEERILIYTRVKDASTTVPTFSYLCVAVGIDGKLIQDFGIGGKLLINLGHNILKSKLIILNSGSLIFASLIQDAMSNKFSINIQNYDKNAKPNLAFGGNGQIQIDVNSTNDFELGSGDKNEFIISYFLDSTMVVSSFNEFGDSNLSFGNDGKMELKIFPDRSEQIKQIVFYDGSFYLSYLGQTLPGVQKPKEYGILKLMENGNLDNGFGLNGFLRLTDTTVNGVELLNLSIIDKYLVCTGRNNNLSLYASINNLNGTYCCQNQYYWNLVYDTLKFRAHPFSFSNFSDEIYVVGNYRAANVNNSDLVLLNLYLNKITSILDLLDAEIYVFPNPTNSYIKINDLNNRCKIVFIYNMSGKLISSLVLDDVYKKQINLMHLPSGLYLLRFLDDEFNQIQTSKILKQ